MYVGLGNAATDDEIVEAVDQGADQLEHLEEACGVGTGCGSCREFAQQIIDQRLAESQTYAA